MENSAHCPKIAAAITGSLLESEQPKEMTVTSVNGSVLTMNQRSRRICLDH